MARATVESGVKNTDQLTFQAEGTDRIELPSADFIADAKMTRDGDNLILETPNGEVAVIENYFSADPAPLLASPDGAVLTPNLVQAFAHSPLEFAANDTASDESPIGAVEEVKGNATVTRADGTVETVSIGTPIYQGDVVETDATGAVNIVFMDETSMAVSEGARLAIDEYSYDPATESGTTNLSVLRGLFVFTSGLIGRDDPDDVKIDTPVGSIGIRGTIIAGEINPNGESNITVLEGAIVVTNGNGESTLSHAFETVRLASFDAPMHEMGVIPAADINTRFASVSSVNPSLFSTISEAVQEQQSQQPVQQQQQAPEAPAPQETPQSQMQPQNAPTAAPAPNQAPMAPTAPLMGDASAAQVQPVAPAPAPVMVDPSISGFGTSTSGLPGANVITGQNSAGVFSPSTNVVVPAGTAPIAPVVMAPPPNSGIVPPPTNTAPPLATQQPPPSVIVPPTTAPAGPALVVTTNPVNDLAGSNTIVGHAIVTGLAATVTYAFAAGSNANNYYQLVSDGAGGVNVVLGTPGEFALRQSLELLDLGDVIIVATPSDGSPAFTRTLDVVINDANAGRIIDLDVNANGVSTISDNIGNAIGYSISALGDINNDGFDDFIFTNNQNGQNYSYIVHGNSAGIPSGPVFDANTAALGNPMDIVSNPTVGGTDTSLTVVSGIGDFNGDGVEDYVIGQSVNTISGIASGNAAIVSGANPLVSRQFGTGIGGGSEVGSDVTGVGDLNNDGFADVVIGASGFGTGTGRAYIVNGSTTWGGTLNSSPFLSGTGGSAFGTSVTGLGDFNGDGYADFAVSAPGESSGNGVVRIYTGQQTGTPTLFAQQAGIGGENLGIEVVGVGDVNGDGYSDMIAAGSNQRGLLLFGSATGGTLNNISFDIPGAYNIMGGGAAGDFNGDGYDDFTIAVTDSNDSKIYVVFGKQGMVDINLDYLKNPLNAFELQYDGASGIQDIEATSIGDVNGDGYDDLAIGFPDADSSNGRVVIVNGRGSGNTTVSSASNATADDQHLVGTRNNDIFNDFNHNNISMRGGAGDDLFRIGNMNFLGVDGGTGLDAMMMQGTSVDFSNINFEKISGIEKIAFGQDNQTMTLTMENIFNLLKTSDDGTLHIGGDDFLTNMTLNLDATAGLGAAATNANIVAALSSFGNNVTDMGTAAGYNEFAIGGYKLYIDTDVTVNIQ